MFVYSRVHELCRNNFCHKLQIYKVLVSEAGLSKDLKKYEEEREKER